MFRVGIVKAQDAANCRVRVTFPDRNQLTSWWLPICVPKSQDDKAYWVPDVGEQVVCMMDEHDEDGTVLGAIYSTVDLPPVASVDKWHISMKDGAIFEYDRAAHSLNLSLPSGAVLTVSANGAVVEIDSSGNLLLNSNAAIKLAGGGPAIARIGDATICPAGQGSIVSGSSKVQSG